MATLVLRSVPKGLAHSPGSIRSILLEPGGGCSRCVKAVRERLYYVENLLQLWGSTLEQRVVAVEQELAASFVDED